MVSIWLDGGLPILFRMVVSNLARRCCSYQIWALSTYFVCRGELGVEAGQPVLIIDLVSLEVDLLCLNEVGLT